MKTYTIAALKCPPQLKCCSECQGIAIYLTNISKGMEVALILNTLEEPVSHAPLLTDNPATENMGNNIDYATRNNSNCGTWN